MPITIKRWDGVEIATVEDADNVRDAVIKLVRKGVSLWRADLSAANLSAADLRAANLSAADLSAADLSAADLSDANLSAANLRAANLSAADLSAADLSAADLSDANLSAANLRAADLSAANLSAADLRAANLSAADLSAANLSDVRDDLFAVLSHAPAEVPALIVALEQGRVNGSTYSDGECGCLVGTLAIASGKDMTSANSCSSVHDLRGNSGRPIESFFYSINRGDTPENSQPAKLAHEWATQWLSRMKSTFGAKDPVGA
jgi:hypothetical protein